MFSLTLPCHTYIFFPYIVISLPSNKVTTYWWWQVIKEVSSYLIYPLSLHVNAIFLAEITHMAGAQGACYFEEFIIVSLIFFKWCLCVFFCPVVVFLYYFWLFFHYYFWHLKGLVVKMDLSFNQSKNQINYHTVVNLIIDLVPFLINCFSFKL